ncbi:DUF7093 family protein [Natronomonas sp.]|uniref:DUF7093 family protein n=1 Tax=Natronomonas sp. TaxID=2184060 RepID=UPI0026073039|nr:hypothetical protein [Natronomonas sp.]
MGFGCLFSHDFGAPEREREREQRGSEVIVTTREVKTCLDCGARQILAENTAIKGRAAASRDAEGADAEGDKAEGETEPAEADADGASGWTTAVIDRPSGGDPDPPEESEHGPGPESGSDAAVTHDAVILTDDSEDSEEADGRAPTEWPEFRAGDETSPDRDGRDDTDTGEGGAATLRCDGCSRAWNPEGSSLIPGDLCPNCRSAYLEEYGG